MAQEIKLNLFEDNYRGYTQYASVDKLIKDYNNVSACDACLNMKFKKIGIRTATNTNRGMVYFSIPNFRSPHAERAKYTVGFSFPMTEEELRREIDKGNPEIFAKMKEKLKAHAYRHFGCENFDDNTDYEALKSEIIKKFNLTSACAAYTFPNFDRLVYTKYKPQESLNPETGKVELKPITNIRYEVLYTGKSMDPNKDTRYNKGLEFHLRAHGTPEEVKERVRTDESYRKLIADKMLIHRDKFFDCKGLE